MKYVQQRAYLFFLNEGIPYGTTVAMAIYVILISLFHKILYVSWIVLQYQSSINIRACKIFQFFFLFFFFKSYMHSMYFTAQTPLSDLRSYMSYCLAKFTNTSKLLALNGVWPKLDWTDMIHKWMTSILLCRLPKK